MSKIYKINQLINSHTPNVSYFFFFVNCRTPIPVPAHVSVFVQLRLCLVHVKYFSENKYFPEMLFSGKENVFRLFGWIGIRFTENQFQCLVRSNISIVFYENPPAPTHHHPQRIHHHPHTSTTQHKNHQNTTTNITTTTTTTKLEIKERKIER